MKWLQSPENQVKRDSDISWDSHGKKNVERACSHLTFEQMLENLVSCLHGPGLLIPLSQCVIPSLAVPTLPAVQTCCVCKDPEEPWLKVFSQIPAGGWAILRPTPGSCGSSEPIQAPQFHECYGWHSSLPHYRTSPLSCSWIHCSPWLAVPHRSPLLVGHLRTFINRVVFSGKWRSPWF